LRGAIIAMAVLAECSTLGTWTLLMSSGHSMFAK
jgi:aryl carrier-like protein